METANKNFESVTFMRKIKVPSNKFGSDVLELGGRTIISVAYRVENETEKQVFCTRCYPSANNLTSWDLEFYNNDAANDYTVIIEGVTAK
ncbi:hypothetical protein BK121_08780 [Paenibacillus odorifer]|uniref:hypothetical protein n=1 Tax=Paenibacillus odorifer TaxID=189426 RepID=UPI00096F88F8|nr:hypothetical protein [Paenibacillus odorifer]OMC72995.1 hypothetical protein BK121_08780 [Paenibacillus odorifer]